MKKEGGHHKSWKTRWFILDHEKISYYRPTQVSFIDLYTLTYRLQC